MNRKVNEPAAGALPVWTRLPPARATCALSGLRRGTLNNLLAQGKVESRLIQTCGGKRGSRLIRVRSLLDYIEHAGTGAGGAS